MTTTPFTFLPDRTSDRATLTFRALPYSLWLHEDVLGVLNVLDRVGGPNLRKRLILVLQHLAAYGRTSIVKGCTGENRGWSRTPLGGGSNGMEHYLWWAREGSVPIGAQENVASGNAIRVRAVRHHNNHAPLTAGDTDTEYLPLSQDSIDGTDQSIGGLPWTDEQQRFISDQSPIRVLIGHPGSGKTLALFGATETSDNQKVLYVSWSRDLTELAEKRLAAFTSEGVDVVTSDFAGLLGTICHTDAPRATYAQSLDSFIRALDRTRISPGELGPWAGREDALYGEFRAILLGRAIPGAPGCTHVDLDPPGRRLARLTDARYREVRGGSTGVGSAGADAFLRVVERIQRHVAPELGGIFPELAAAAESIHRLCQNDLPDGFSGFNRIVVDEVQDLTLTELAVIVELCRAVARRSGNIAPSLLLAGDEGQTVRPVGFEWALLSELLSNRLQAPSQFFLDTPLRSPQGIAQVIENASRLYARFPRGRRPARQQHEAGGQPIEARLFYVEVPDKCAAVTLLKRLGSLPGLAIVALENQVPDWVREPLQDMVLTPAIVKGLEYQAVVVLNPGELLKNLRDGIPEHTDAPELEEHHRRAAIDRLRVAVSRASETLVFVDVAADDAARALARELLGDPAVYDAEDLIAFLSDTDTDTETPLEDAIRRRIDEVGHLIDEAPGRAWQLAVQSVKQLRGQDSLNSISESVRREGQMVLLTTAARLLVDGLPPRVRRDEVLDQAKEATAGLETPEMGAAFSSWADWTLDRSMSPFALLDAATALGQEAGWMRSAIRSVYPTLIASLDRCAKSPREAGAFAGDVESWLRLIGHTEDVNGTAMGLRRSAVTTLLNAGDVGQAERILPAIQPPSPVLAGLHLEAQGQWEEAAEVYAQAGLDEDTNRVRGIGAQAYFDKGGTDYHQRRINSAIENYTAGIKLNPDSAKAYNSRGLFYGEIEQYDLAVLDLTESIRLDPDDAGPYFNRGAIYIRQSKFRQAIADLDDALALDPHLVAAYRLRGSVHYTMGNFGNALADFDKAVELSPDDTEALLSRGNAYDKLGRYAQAIEDYTVVIRLEPKGDTAYLNRGNVYYDLGRFEEAIEDYTVVIRLEPKGHMAYMKRGNAYYYLGRFEEAIADYTVVIRLEPKGDTAYLNRSNVYYDLGQFEAAIADLATAIQCNPGHADAYSRRSEANRSLGQHELADADDATARRLRMASGGQAPTRNSE